MAITLNGTTGITTPAIDNQGNLTVDGGTIKLDGNYPVGTGNVALGDNVFGVGNLSGSNNTAIGTAAMYDNSTGAWNLAAGYLALENNTTGSYNVALGGSALGLNYTGSSNTAVGYAAGYTSESTAGNTFLGNYAGNLSTGASNTYVGSGAGYLMSTGARNTILGQYSGNQGGLDIRTANNNIVLSDGDGNPKMYYAQSQPMWVINNNTNGQWVGRIRHDGTSDVYGLIITYNNATINADSNPFIYCNDSTTVRFIVNSNGNVTNTNNSYGAISDEKLKENIVDAASQWDDIKALTVRKYSLKADELDAPNMLGVIAQEVETAGMGGLVYETQDQDGDLNDLGTVTKAVNYSILYMKAVKALQEAMTRIETLEAKVSALEA